jgi:glycosyltransferase involved in cell wall biosynthesis
VTGVAGMRVLQLIPTLGFAGAERQLAYLGRGLQRLGFEVHVGTLAEEHDPFLGLHRKLLVDAGARAWHVPSRSPYDPRLLPRILGLMRKVEPALVQTWIPMMDVLGGAAAALTGTPWILSERNTPDFFPPELKNRVREALARRFAAAVVSNSASGDAYWARRAPTVPRHVVRNALLLEEIDAAPAVPVPIAGVPAEGPLVLAAGRFKPQKNVWNLLDALGRVAGASGAAVLVCGEGYDHAEAVRRIEERGLSGRIRAPGFVGDVWSWMKRAQVFVSVSYFEGMPNSVMEAMACGCPLVVSDIPMHREIVGDDGALFVDPDDPEAIAARVLEVLADPARAKSRADRARALARSWSVGAAAERYAEIYEGVVRGARGAR